MRVALGSEEASCILRSQRGAYTRLAQLKLLAYNVSISVLYGARKKTHFYATAGHHHITPTTSIAATRRPEPSNRRVARIRENPTSLTGAPRRAQTIIIMNRFLLALALLAASATAKLDITKGNSLRGDRRRLGKGKHGGGKSGEGKGGKSGYDENEDEDDCSCDAAYEELELCKEKSESCQDELEQCTEQIQINQKECSEKTAELQDQIIKLTEALEVCENESEATIAQLQKELTGHLLCQKRSRPSHSSILPL